MDNDSWSRIQTKPTHFVFAKFLKPGPPLSHQPRTPIGSQPLCQLLFILSSLLPVLGKKSLVADPACQPLVELAKVALVGSGGDPVYLVCECGRAFCTVDGGCSNFCQVFVWVIHFVVILFVCFESGFAREKKNQKSLQVSLRVVVPVVSLLSLLFWRMEFGCVEELLEVPYL